MMEKVIRDGKVGVLISAGYGAGWYSWHGIEELLYDPRVIAMLENPDDEEDLSAIVNYCHQKYGEHEYFGGVDGLYVVWVPVGSRFLIEDYDGAESIRFENAIPWITA